MPPQRRATRTSASGAAAQAQIQEIRPQAVQEQTVTAQQSQEISQIFLYAAVSSILCYRNLLPQERFDEVVYGVVNQHWSYGAFIRQEQERFKDMPDDIPIYRMQIMKRGASTRADQLIEYLETGVFEGVKKGYVDEMRLAITDGPDDTKIQELYSFQFQYTHPGTDAAPLVNVNMSGPNGTSITLRDARKDLRNVVMRIVGVAGVAPKLPAQPHVRLHLLYNTRCPHSYQTKGFVPTTVPLNSPTSEWEQPATHCGTVHTGFQSVSLQVSFKGETPSIHQEDEAVIPNPTMYGKTLGRHDDVDATTDSQLPVSSKVFQSQAGQETNSTPPKKRADKEVLPSTEDVDLDLPHGGVRNGTGKIRRDDVLAQRALVNMQQPFQVPNAQETQQLADLRDMAKKIEFTQDTLALLDGERNLRLGPGWRESRIQRRSESAAMIGPVDQVKCQCGHDDHGDDMICCSFCETWQHIHCYGYRGLDDARAPVEHACYACLLQDKDDSLLMELEALAMKRHAIHLLEERDFESESQFASALGCKKSDSSRLLKELGNQGITVPINRSKKSNGAKKVGLCKSQNAIRTTMDKYFDPAFGIRQFLVLSSFHSNAPLANNVLNPAGRGGRKAADSSSRRATQMQPALVDPSQEGAESSVVSPGPSRKRPSHASLLETPSSKRPHLSTADLSFNELYTPLRGR